jgi:hypothetical protein
VQQTDEARIQRHRACCDRSVHHARRPPLGGGEKIRFRRGFHSPFFLDDINYSYTPDDYSPMKTLHILIFDGKDWQISDQPVTE